MRSSSRKSASLRAKRRRPVIVSKGSIPALKRNIFFVDTPGFQTRYGGPLNQSLNRIVTAALSAVDVCLFVVEAGRYDARDQQALAQIDAALTTLLIANKVDRLADKGGL